MTDGLGPSDWGQASVPFDALRDWVGSRDLPSENEAQVRYDVLDRFIREVLGWSHGQVRVEEPSKGPRRGFVDYVMRSADIVVVVEAKKAGAAFPSPTRQRRLKLSGAVLGNGPIAEAIRQARDYAIAKRSDVAVVTNGACWCAFSPNADPARGYGSLFFPFSSIRDAEDLFNLLARRNVETGSLSQLVGQVTVIEDRLLSVVPDADDPIERNNVADFILPAVNAALYADALLSNAADLRNNYVTTDERVRFDTQLGVHLADARPRTLAPARRIRRGRRRDELSNAIAGGVARHAPPVTLIMGPVGAGKSTYLKHFELVAGRGILDSEGTHWIYVDFEGMGPGDDPRAYMYSKIRAYLVADHPDRPTDWDHAVMPAYAEEIAGLARGPLAPLRSSDPAAFDAHVSQRIASDYDRVEPYVDRIVGYLSRVGTCILVLDNIDLYENEQLEATVFAEGLALSKRVMCHVIVSIRERTFVRHRRDSVFDAYELRRLWLDPPPFREVLSKRLIHARRVLEGRSAHIPLENEMTLYVTDLAPFFDTVQRSVLSGQAGSFIEAMADQDIRRGLGLITDFLTSGHIEADRAVRAYLDGQTDYVFPFHEVFKGAILGRWMRFREERANCLNLFDARLGSKRLQLLRYWALSGIALRAQSEHAAEVPVQELIDLFGSVGAAPEQFLACLNTLRANALIREMDGQDVFATSAVAITRAGAYHVRVLSRSFAYVDAVLLDTAIHDASAWEDLSARTATIELTRRSTERVSLRAQRASRFMDYLVAVESEVAESEPRIRQVSGLEAIRAAVRGDSARAVWRASRRRYPDSVRDVE